MTLARRCLLEECSLQRDDLVLVAVSGGPDSMALLHVMSRLAARHRIRLHACGVDHGLRPEAACELELAAQLARDLDVPFSHRRVHVHPGSNLQARARSARHDSLRQELAVLGGGVIATGHHADDRAETVLLRLLRGSGPRGLAALPARANNLIRPLIRARRSDITAHLMRHSVSWAEDPSNKNRRFMRVRVRHELLPLLETMSPQIVTHLNTLADQLAAGQPPTLVDGEGRPVELNRTHIQQIVRAQRFGHANASVLLPGGRRVRFVAGQPFVVPEAEPISGRSG